MKAAKTQNRSAGLGSAWPQAGPTGPKKVTAVRKHVAELSEPVLHEGWVVPDRVIDQDELSALGMRQGLTPAFGAGLELGDVTAGGRGFGQRGAGEAWAHCGNLGAKGVDALPAQTA